MSGDFESRGSAFAIFLGAVIIKTVSVNEGTGGRERIPLLLLHRGCELLRIRGIHTRCAGARLRDFFLSLSFSLPLSFHGGKNVPGHFPSSKRKKEKEEADARSLEPMMM